MIQEFDFPLDKTCAQVQKVALEILKTTVELCERNNVRYVMFYGTLLGAVRHKGFIPWDDDLDIVMPREDFERFRALCTEQLPEWYFFQDYTTDPEYPSVIAKVRDSRTTMIENGYRDLKRMNHGIFLDVFVADGYSKKLLNPIRLFLVRLYRSMLLRRTCGSGNKLLLWAAKLFGRNSTFKKIDKHLKKLGSWEKLCIAENKVFSTDAFDDYIYTDFEGLRVRIPRAYDAILTEEYGDYMTPPPYEKRVPLHKTELTDVNSPYTDHIDKN